MSFFGIYTPEASADVSVISCHINVWVLPNRWWRVRWRHRYYIDVGLRLEAKPGTSSFNVVLPFDAERTSALEDLSALVLDETISALMFGRPTTVQGSRLIYSGSSFGAKEVSDVVKPISSEDSRPLFDASRTLRESARHVWNLSISPRYRRQYDSREGPDHNGISKWRVAFEAVQDDEREIYVRFRAKLPKPDRVWISKGWGFAKKGYLASLRFNDTREALSDRTRISINEFKSIPQIFVFLAMPAYLTAKHVSPPLFYSRLLEPHVWERYLRTCEPYSKSNKIAIHQWRNKDSIDSAGEVNENSPFRIYGDFSREFGAQLLLIYSIGIIFPFIATLSEWVIRYFFGNYIL